MNINEKKEKRDNFIKIYDLVSLNRNISLIQINLLLRTIRNVYEFFLIGQFLLAQFSPQRSFSAKLSLLTKKAFARQNINLWIYPSSNEKYTQNFFDQIEAKILENYTEKDFIVPLGVRAINFAKKNDMKIITSFENLDNSFENSVKIGQVIEYGLKTRQFSSVKMAVYSNKIPNFIATIFPLNQFEFKMETTQETIDKFKANLDKVRFFPNFEEFYQTQIQTYFATSVQVLLLESQFIVYKNKLIHENTLLKEIEEKILRLKTTILKIERELEIEELNLIKSKPKGIF
ncbi:MSC_0622 family F1-like ATPase gamma subunit [Mesomycoplasma ovipneumoniae]